MAFIDLINILRQRIQERYTDKTLPLSIKKTDHANTFNDVADLLLLVNPTDENKTIPFTQEQAYTINWQTDMVPGTTVTYAVFFGNNPIFSVATATDPSVPENTDITNVFIKFRRNPNLIDLETVDFDFGPFATDGVIIIR